MADVEIIREGYWICPNCRSKNTGSLIQCSSCGAARGEVEFFYDESAAEVTDASEKAKALEGPDWVCAYCSTSNPAGTSVCKQCAGARDSGKKRIQRDLPPRPTTDKPPAGSVAPAPPVPGWVKKAFMGMFGLLILLGYLATTTSDYQAEITACRWQRSIELQQFVPVTKSDWRNQTPTGARTLREERKVRSHRKVLEGYRDVQERRSEKVKTGSRRVKTGVKDLGNGRFKETWSDQPIYETRYRTVTVSKPFYRQEPIYDTWVTYEVNEWKAMETITSSGRDEIPAWPVSGVVSRTGPPQLGDRREGPRQEEYGVTFKLASDNKAYETTTIDLKPISADQFLKLRPGTRWVAVYNGLGQLVAMNSPAAGAAPKP